MKKKAPSKKPPSKRADAKAQAPTDKTLVGWPNIAAYLGQPISVAQRWAKSGMPVTRKGRSMSAQPEELSAWLGKEAGFRQPVHVAQASDDDLVKELRRGLKEARESKSKE